VNFYALFHGKITQMASSFAKWKSSCLGLLYGAKNLDRTL